VAPNSKIAALRVLDNNGYGSFTRIVKAIDFAIANQIRILNISLSFGVSSVELISALKKAAAHNIVVVMAAGNDGATIPGWIARESANIPGIVVGGATQLGAIASFSNRSGADQNYILAPGENVITTYINGTTAELWGTSLAAPYVSGATALLFEAIPNLSAAAVIAIIKRTSSNILPV
jgi:subtilisin family serine protease